MGKTCVECGFENINDSAMCENCGYPFETVICPECQHENEEIDTVCKNCGYPLKEDSRKKNKSAVLSKLIAAIVCLFMLLLIGITSFNNSRNKFKEELVSHGTWNEAKYGYNVSFSDDGMFKYTRVDWQGMDAGLNFEIAVAEYKVLSKNTVKIGKQKVKIKIGKDDTLKFEPDFNMIIQRLDETDGGK